MKSHKRPESDQERRCIREQEEPGFWESVPLLMPGAAYLLNMPVANTKSDIGSRITHWLDEYFQGNSGHICQRDCEDFIQQNPDFNAHEPAMVLAIAEMIVAKRLSH